MLSKEKNAGIYPNTFRESLTIELTAFSNQGSLFQIYNSTGKLMYFKQFNSDETLRVTELTHLRNGLYILKINIGNKIYTASIYK